MKQTQGAGALSPGPLFSVCSRRQAASARPSGSRSAPGRRPDPMKPAEADTDPRGGPSPETPGERDGPGGGGNTEALPPIAGPAETAAPGWKAVLFSERDRPRPGTRHQAAENPSPEGPGENCRRRPHASGESNPFPERDRQHPEPDTPPHQGNGPEPDAHTRRRTRRRRPAEGGRNVHAPTHRHLSPWWQFASGTGEPPGNTRAAVP